MTYCIPLVKDQNSFDEISGLAICVNIEVFNRVNIKQLKTALKDSKDFWNIWNFLSLLTEDVSALIVA